MSSNISMPVVRVETTPIRYIEEEDKRINTADLIFDEWEKDKEYVINQLKNEFMINIESSTICSSESLSLDEHFMINGTCKGCKKIKTFLEDYTLPENKEFTVYSGKNKGMIIKMFSLKNIDIMIDYTSKFVKIRNPFMNYMIISCILDRALFDYPSKIPYLYSYICKDTFNILVNSKRMKSIREISLKSKFSKSSPLSSVYNRIHLDISIQIFKQLVALCYHHKGLEFSHGEPSYSYINFSIEPVNFTYCGIKINSQLMLCISPSTKSCINFYGRRVCKKDNTYLEMVEYKDKECFKIGNRGDKFLRSRNAGIYKFFDFDFIMFFAALIVDKSFSKEHIIDYWEGIWKKSEYVKLMNELKNVKINNFDNLFKILKNYHMKFNCLNEVKCKLSKL